MAMETIEIEPSIEAAPADVVRSRARRRPIERPASTTPQPPCLQAIHACKEGFILRGIRSDTFWEW